jgi:hypothetical protein
MQNSPTPFALWRNNYTYNLSAVSYPIREFIRAPADLKRAVAYDHVFAEFKDGVNKYGQTIFKHRKNDNFILSDCIALDVDNSDTNNPDEWLTLERLQADFSDVEFYVATSRNHLKTKIKDGVNQSPRPKFHLYFPIPKVTTTAEYTKLKKLTVTAFSYFDPNAVDCARVFIGNPNAEIFFFSGKQKLSEFILKKSAEKLNQNAETEPQMRPPRYKNIAVIPQGMRNNHMHSVACSLLFKNGDSNETRAKYTAESLKCSPPLDQIELNSIYSSALKWYTTEIITKPDYIRRGSLSGVSQENNPKILDNQPKKWKPPIPFGEIIPSPFPVFAFPKTLAEYIRAVAEFSETDPAMCGVLLLGVLGGVFQRKYEIVGTAGNTEQLSIFALAIAESSERKSGVIKLITKPFGMFEKEYNSRHKSDLSENKAQKKVLARTLEQAEKDGDDATIFAAQKAFDEFEIREPVSLVVDDTTPEALTAKLVSQGERVIVIAAEGGFFKRIKGRYTPNNDDKNIYLKAHSGDRHSVDRIGRPPEVLENPAISIIMIVQKIIVEGFLADDENQGTGMTARFLYTFCAERAGNRQPTRPRTFAEYERVFEGYNQLIIDILFQLQDEKQIKQIKMSDNAFKLACEYYFITEKRIQTAVSGAKSWHGKSFGLMLRIAGILHCFEVFERRCLPDEYQVSADNINSAIALVDCFSEHADKAFNPHDKTNADAAYLLNRIKSVLPQKSANDNFTRTELLRLTHGRFKKAEELNEPLILLQDLGYIDTDFLQTGGRPAERITVNPQLSVKK